MTFMLKAPGIKRLKLEYLKLLSMFVFNFPLRRYSKGAAKSEYRNWYILGAREDDYEGWCTAGAKTRPVFSST